MRRTLDDLEGEMRAVARGERNAPKTTYERVQDAVNMYAFSPIPHRTTITEEELRDAYVFDTQPPPNTIELRSYTGRRALEILQPYLDLSEMNEEDAESTNTTILVVDRLNPTTALGVAQISRRLSLPLDAPATGELTVDYDLYLEWICVLADSAREHVLNMLKTILVQTFKTDIHELITGRQEMPPALPTDAPITITPYLHAECCTDDETTIMKHVVDSLLAYWKDDVGGIFALPKAWTKDTLSWDDVDLEI